ncbi:hypothetical protein AB1Y20_005405 [Prymnesium parvum]|uniref:Major facilitator superfamily (MFS) profile domain-containing protein n=1 Tax=Prymnesium parvum TaxID=97485 RepID=A0AB34J756_PRYPA
MTLQRPSLALAALAFGLTANTLAITNIFPYAPFMAKAFGLTADDRELGFYAGFFMSSLMLGAGLSAYAWGVVADRHGRKRVILFGLASSVAPQLLFGVATSMAWALTCRFVIGLLNGVSGAAKALAPELVPPSEQAGVMSMIAATWGLGNLLGPAIGGTLSRYHLCEAEAASGAPSAGCPAFPFLWPNLVCAAAAAAGGVAVALLLPDDRRRAERAALRDATHAPSDAPSDAAPPPPRAAAAPVGFYGCVALLDIINSEVFPLWCVAPRPSGGLGLGANEVGAVLSVSGLALLVFQLLIFPCISRRVSVTRSCSCACALCGPLYLLLPFITRFEDDRLVMGALLVYLCLLRCAAGTTFTCAFTILNNGVPPDERGKMQGVAMTVGSIARGVGPTLGAELFAWSLTNGLPSPFDIHFTFVLLCLFNTVPVAIAMCAFTRALDRPFGATDTRTDAPSDGFKPKDIEIAPAAPSGHVRP